MLLVNSYRLTTAVDSYLPGSIPVLSASQEMVTPALSVIIDSSDAHPVNNSGFLTVSLSI